MVGTERNLHFGASAFFQNIEEGKKYEVIFYVRSTGPIDLKVSLTDSIGVTRIASTDIK